MRSKLLAVAAALLLSSCKPTGTDGYTFEKAQFTQTSFTVTMVLVQNEQELVKLAPPAAIKLQGSKGELFAFGKVGPNRCTIYAVDPAAQYRPQNLGHELTHCIYGEWHPEQNKERQ
jgi:hypothetical protein